MPRLTITALLSAGALLLTGAVSPCAAQSQALPQRTPPTSQYPWQATGPATPPADAPSDPRAQLQAGSRLTRQGYLQQAIPNLLAAQRAGLAPYAVGVDLGICYLGTGQYQKAISVLESLDSSGPRAALVDNLLSQAYIADGQSSKGFQVFLQAASLDPQNEKLYDFLADTCTDHKHFHLGLKIVDYGLTRLPRSARLHYEKAMFLAQLDSLDQAKPEFDRAAQLDPRGYIGYLAQVQKYLYEDDLSAADKVLHQAILAGHHDFRTYSLLGTVLLHEGATPGQPQFAEAKKLLLQSAQEQPNYPSTQIALGRIFLMLGNARQAVQHLQIARRLQPDDPAVYTNLANAYELLGQRSRARNMRRQLGRLLAQRETQKTPQNLPLQH